MEDLMFGDADVGLALLTDELREENDRAERLADLDLPSKSAATKYHLRVCIQDYVAVSRRFLTSEVLEEMGLISEALK